MEESPVTRFLAVFTCRGGHGGDGDIVDSDADREEGVEEEEEEEEEGDGDVGPDGLISASPSFCPAVIVVGVILGAMGEDRREGMRTGDEMRGQGCERCSAG